MTAGANAGRLERAFYGAIGGEPGALNAALRILLALGAAVHRVCLEAYLIPYRAGIRRKARLSSIVVSVGNIASGGTGKTPFTAALVAALAARGMTAAVVSRGYGGRRKQQNAVVSDGSQILMAAVESGDEPRMLAEMLPETPVVVGRDRRQSGRLAVDRFHPDVIVLDDGMQYWQLHRDFELALVRADERLADARLLPAGLLREPPSHLRRASAIIATRTENLDGQVLQQRLDEMAMAAPGVAVYASRLVPVDLVRLCDNVAEPVETLHGTPVTAFSAIADPAGFEAMLARQGARIVATLRRHDHANLNADDWGELLARADNDGSLLVMTEKDAVKAPANVRARARALRVRCEAEGLDGIVAQIETAVRGRRHE